MFQQKIWIRRIKLSQQILIDRLVILQAIPYFLLVFKIKLPEIKPFVGATSNTHRSHSTFNRYLHRKFCYFLPLQPQIHVGPMFLFEKNEIHTITASPHGTVTVVFSVRLFLSNYHASTRSTWLFFKAENSKTHWCNWTLLCQFWCCNGGVAEAWDSFTHQKDKTHFLLEHSFVASWPQFKHV